MPAITEQQIEWGPFIPPRFRDDILEFIERQVRLLRDSGIDPGLDRVSETRELYKRIHRDYREMDSEDREALAEQISRDGLKPRVSADRWYKYWYKRRQGWWIYTWLGDYMVARPLWMVAWLLAERTGWQENVGKPVELLEWAGKQPQGARLETAPAPMEQGERGPAALTLVRENVILMHEGRAYPHPDAAARVRTNLKQTYELEPYLKDRLVSEQGSRMTVRWSDGRMLELSAGELLCWLADWGDVPLREDRTWWPWALYEIADNFDDSPFKRSELAELVDAGQEEIDDFLQACEYLGVLQREPERGHQFFQAIDIRREARRMGKMFRRMREDEQ